MFAYLSMQFALTVDPSGRLEIRADVIAVPLTSKTADQRIPADVTDVDITQTVGR